MQIINSVFTRYNTLTLVRWAIWLLIIACAVVLIFLLSFAEYIRPLQDDFAYRTPNSLDELSIILRDLYGWSGRWTSMTLFFIIGALQLYQIVPFIGFGVLIVGCYSLSSTLLVNKIRPKWATLIRPISLLIGILVALGFYFITPSPYSTLYWLSAAPIHLWSYGLIMVLFAWIIQLSRKSVIKTGTAVLVGIFTFTIGVMGEIAAFILVSFFGLAFICSFFRKKAALYRLYAAGIGGSILALFILFFSQGAQNRRLAEHTEFGAGLLLRFPRVIVENFYELFASILNNQSLIVVLFVVAICLGFLLKRPVEPKKAMVLWLTVIVFLACVMALNYVAVYTSTHQLIVWSRAQALSTIIVLGVAVYSGLLTGSLMRPWLISKSIYRLAVISLGICVTSIMVLHGGHYASYLSEFQSTMHDRAEDFDTREKQIREIRDMGICRTLHTSILNNTQEGFDVVKGEPSVLNVQFSQYYRLPCVVQGSMTMEEARRKNGTLREER